MIILRKIKLESGLMPDEVLMLAKLGLGFSKKPEGNPENAVFSLELSAETLAFYDIETTGLSRSASFLYLIGAVSREENDWVLRQWLAQSETDEPALLEAFRAFLKDRPLTIQYNGDSFDAPYLEARCQAHNLPPLFENRKSLDLYRVLKSLKELLGLERMKQPDLEALVGNNSRIFVDGKECIRLYKTYVLRRSDALAAAVLGHNAEDLSGLLNIFPLLGCLTLYNGTYEISAAVLADNQARFTLSLPLPLPVKISCTLDGFQLTAEGHTAIVTTKTHHGKLRRYYPNYRDYYYLPGEDTAIPRTIGSFLDKSLRRPARPETCYTWFPCTREFLNNPVQQKEYLANLLPIILIKQ